MNTLRRTLDRPHGQTRSSKDPSDAARPRIYDPYSLATRPLPAALELFPHPKGIDAAAARRITGGVVC